MSIDRGMDKHVAHTYNGILVNHKKNETGRVTMENGVGLS